MHFYDLDLYTVTVYFVLRQRFASRVFQCIKAIRIWLSQTCCRATDRMFQNERKITPEHCITQATSHLKNETKTFPRDT